MNEESRSVEICDDSSDLGWTKEPGFVVSPVPAIPSYLSETYWWAYLHPNSFWFFEREWVVNLILWGNMKRLTEAVLEEIPQRPLSRVLQMACVYGDFSNKLASTLRKNGSSLDIADVAPIQLKNVKEKLKESRNVRYLHQNSAAMSLPDNQYDQTVVFFLLHEMPEDVRKATISEAIRVTRPGGKIVFVDYHGPGAFNPLRYLMKPLLKWLEPFAMDLWQKKIPDWVPEDSISQDYQYKQYFGGLYQKVVVTKI